MGSCSLATVSTAHSLVCSVDFSLPHICGPHSDLPNCRYFDNLSKEKNPNWVPAAGTGTMDPKKRMPRQQFVHHWEPKITAEKVKDQNQPEEIKQKKEPENNLNQNVEENIFPRKRRSDLRPAI